MKHTNVRQSRTRSVWALAAVAAAGASFLLVDTAEAAGSATKPSVCTRSCWSARSASLNTNMSGLNRAVIHHTAGTGDYNTSSLSTSAGKVRSIQNYHMDVNGWSDIGYHYLVDKLGNTFEGRRNADTKTEQRRGAHDGTNYNSFGYNVMGYYHPPYNQSFTTASKNALWQLIAWRMPNGWSPYGSGSYAGKTVGYVAGHRNVKATACPGDGVYATIGTNYSGGTARNGINAIINPAPSVTIVTRDNTHSGFTASGNWGVATWASDKHGTNYAYRDTEAISDAAQWTASLPSSGSWRVDAWWTAAANRATSAPYIVHHGSTTTTAARNQTINGGKWNSLGTYTMSTGKVQLSCWTSSGDVVVADAVRWVK